MEIRWVAKHGEPPGRSPKTVRVAVIWSPPAILPILSLGEVLTMSQTRKDFEAHVRDLERRAIAGDQDACKSLACMALLVEGFPDPDGGELIDLLPFLRRAA